MADSHQTLLSRLQERFNDQQLLQGTIAFDELTIDVATDELLTVCTALRDEFDFEELIDLCGVDYSTYKQVEWKTKSASSTGFSRGINPILDEVGQGDPDKRFAVVYHLISIKNNTRIRVRSFAKGTPPIIDSVVTIWNGCNWFEREAFDLYGILFAGHPDLRRILTDYGFIGHPFRKDFPLTGNVEMRYDPELKRVVYEPAQVEPRVLIPRVIREDTRYAAEDVQEGTV